MFEVQVSQVEFFIEQVKCFMLVVIDGKLLFVFIGGSYVIVQMSDGDNQYSNVYLLLSLLYDIFCYQIVVWLEENLCGGFCFLYQQVKVGNWLMILMFNNLFVLIFLVRKYLFIVGGIGIIFFLLYMVEL